MLYNEKRTATVRALSDVKVWVLDGEIFKAIVASTVKRRRLTELGFLDKVDLFSKMDKYEKT